MTQQYQLENLAYRDPRQTFAQAVVSCPAYMSVREAIQNAIDAATDPEFVEAFGPKSGRIEFTTTAGDDIEDGMSGRKFGVLSYGRAMNFEELVSYTDIGAGAKARGLEKNYGIGVKLAGLAASPAGLIIRTFNPNYHPSGLDPEFCVGEVILVGRIDDDNHMTYGRLRLSPESVENPCLRIISKEQFPDRDWSTPWTEVIFAGNAADQDTVSELFALPAGLLNKHFWTMNSVNCRYYKLPPGLEVYRANISQPNVATAAKNARGLYVHVVDLWSKPEDGGNHSTISAAHRIFGRCFITYGLLEPGKSCNSTLQASGIPTENQGNGHAALVYRGEIYDGAFGKLWPSMASKFGLPHGQKRLYVHIELIDDLLQPQQDRTKLRVKRMIGLPDSEVKLEDFADIVRHPDHIPTWVKTYMEDVSSTAIRSASLQDELKRLIEQLRAHERLERRTRSANAGEEADVVDLPGGGLEQAREGDKPGREPPMRRKRGVSLPSRTPEPPDVEWVTIEGSEGHFTNDRQGAHFDKDANILRLNLEYHGFKSHLNSLVDENVADDEESRMRIESTLRDEYGYRVASHIISAFHNRNARVIEPTALDAIFSPENFICLMTTFDNLIRMGFNERYRRLKRQVQHG